MSLLLKGSSTKTLIHLSSGFLEFWLLSLLLPVIITSLLSLLLTIPMSREGCDLI